jgi:hypothetical protein
MKYVALMYANPGRTKAITAAERALRSRAPRSFVRGHQNARRAGRDRTRNRR